jgi:hypothetical protein
VAQLLLYNIRLLLQKQDAMNVYRSEKLYIKRPVVEISLDIKINIMSPNVDFLRRRVPYNLRKKHACILYLDGF